MCYIHIVVLYRHVVLYFYENIISKIDVQVLCLLDI